ncbi:MAG TPA: endolytic transglycosylase MltG [Mycobacteriales bacterium]|nr:endolytic transglycosylase MltG [Mycobacteriales bacterium]
MTDVLDLADGRPPRPRRRPPRRSPVAKTVAVLFVLLLVAALAGGAWYGGKRVLSAFADAPDYPGPGSGEVVVQIEPGQTAAAVATTLKEQDVIASRSAFLEVANPDPRAGSLQPGFYRLLRQMRAADAFELLLDPASRVLGRVTIPEGYTVEQTLEALGKGTEIPLEEYQAAIQDTAAIGLPEYARGNPEGFLFPATYDVEPDMTATDVLRMMTTRFQQAADSLGLEARAAELGITPYQAVIVGSLIERESRIDEELPKVSRVVYNRLEDGIPLGIDAAVLYGLGRTSGGLTASDLARDTPYENRRRAGLPPTPIASPGEAALTAALQPEDGPWLYYVLADRDGRHLFTDDYDEFLRQKAKSQREGIF